MKMKTMNRVLAKLSNKQLIQKGDRAVRTRHELAIEVLDCLIEIDRRSLYLSEGYSSLFNYCTRRWNYSHPKAGRTIMAARCMKNFPGVRDLLVKRKITLCGVSRIAAILTEENCEELLRRVSGKRYIEIEKIVASLRTAPAIREIIRPIGKETPVNPEKGADHADLFHPAWNGDRSENRYQFDSEDAGNGGRPENRYQFDSDSSKESEQDPSDSDGEEPKQRYEIRFSASEEFYAKLKRAQAVCSRRWSLEAILEKGLDELLERHDPERKEARRAKRKAKEQNSGGAATEMKGGQAKADCNPGAPKMEDEQKRPDAHRELFPETNDRGASPRTPVDRDDKLESLQEDRIGATSPGQVGRDNRMESFREDAGGEKSRGDGNPETERRSRHIPAPVRDAVFTRDEGRCTYSASNVVRCEATAHLQIDHIQPFCRGGEHTLENLRVLCGKHNRLAARELSLST